MNFIVPTSISYLLEPTVGAPETVIIPPRAMLLLESFICKQSSLLAIISHFSFHFHSTLFTKKDFPLEQWLSATSCLHTSLRQGFHIFYCSHRPI